MLEYREELQGEEKGSSEEIGQACRGSSFPVDETTGLSQWRGCGILVPSRWASNKELERM